jgi:hypothetical protein
MLIVRYDLQKREREREREKENVLLILTMISIQYRCISRKALIFFYSYTMLIITAKQKKRKV